MAKKALLDVLQKSIGRYVRNLDAENLNVSIWSGSIDLNDMELDIESINRELSLKAKQTPDSAVPLRAISGSFSKITIEIPWTRITSRPVVVKAHGLSVLVEPYDHVASLSNLISTGSTINEEEIRIHRMKDIEEANAFRESANAIQDLSVLSGNGSGEKESDQNSSYTSRLTQRIIENLQFDIEDINIGMKGAEFSAGIRLKSLSIFSTDDKGQRKFVDRTTDSFLYKTLNMNEFAIYCTDVDVTNNLAPEAYLLSPFSLEMNLRMSDSEKCVDFPKYRVNSQLPKVHLNLSQDQLNIINDIGRCLQTNANISHPLYPEYRPDVPIKNGVKLWWKYAYRCVGRITRKTSWKEFYIAFNTRKRYLELYAKSIYSSYSWVRSLSDSEAQEIEVIHHDKSIAVEAIMGWRNVVDAKLKREIKTYEDQVAKKNASRSYFQSFFGRSNHNTEKEEVKPVINLTVDELKEIESLTLSTSEISEDSWICDLDFKLISFQIDLIMNTPITSFVIKSASATYLSYANGSNKVGLCISSVIVDDLVTKNSYFPSLLRALDPSSLKTNVFTFVLEKSRNGDQNLTVKASGVELVASPKLIQKIKSFFTLNPALPKLTSNKESQLISNFSSNVGESQDDEFFDAEDTEDEFEDAVEDMDFNILENVVEVTATATNAMTDKFTEALQNAWVDKRKNKMSWFIDVDIDAPVIIIPETCTKPDSSMILFDLGHLHLRSVESCGDIKEWFHSHEKNGKIMELEQINLEVSSLSVMLGKVAMSQKKSENKSLKYLINDDVSIEHMLEPLTFNVSVGMEKNSDVLARTCLFGNLQEFSITISFDQITESLSILNAWQKYIDDMSPNEDKPSNDIQQVHLLEHKEGEAETNIVEETKNLIEEKSGDLMHIFFALRKLSLTFRTTNGSLEAHLVSTTASSTITCDGYKKNQLSMGWFWVVDNLDSVFPRYQRLIIHSNLPSPAEEYASKNNFNILEQLDSLGVFGENCREYSELAEMGYHIFTEKNLRGDIFNEEENFLLQVRKELSSSFRVFLLDINLSGLNINCNPESIKNIVKLQKKVFSLVEKPSAVTEQNSAEENHIALDKKKAEQQRFQTKAADSNENETDSLSQSESSLSFIRARLGIFQVTLNSVKDDLPIFDLSLLEMRFNFFTLSSELQLEMSISDLNVTASKDRLNPFYCNIFGIEQRESTNLLLKLRYCQGNKMVRRFTNDESQLDEWANIQLQAMRVVFINRVIDTLIKYACVDVLGSLKQDDRVSSNDNSTPESPSSNQKIKLYLIEAKGLFVIVPLSGTSESFIKMKALDFFLKHNELGAGAGTNTVIAIGKVIISCSKELPLIEEPFDISSSISSTTTDSIQKSEIRTKVSNIAFSVSREHYVLLMSIVRNNLGGQDNFMRIDPHETCLYDSDAIITNSITKKEQTKSGNEKTEDQNKDKPPSHIYVECQFSTFSLRINGNNEFDPILYFAAYKSNILLKYSPHLDNLSMNFVLSTIMIEDQRIATMGRAFRQILSYQKGSSNEQVLFFNFTKESNNTRVSVELGSIQTVFILDILPDLIKFLLMNETADTSITSSNSDVRRLKKNNLDTASVKNDVVLSNKTIFSFKTSDCRFLIGDMGDLKDLQSKSKSTSNVKNDITEVIALECNLSLIFEQELDNKIDTKKLEAHFHSVEIYVAHGNELTFPVQILDPSSFHTILKISVGVHEDNISMKLYTLDSVDFIISMQNIALANAIVSNFFETLTLISSSENLEEAQDIIVKDADETIVTTKDLNLNLITSISQTSLTLVNDLLGLDQALLKVVSQDLATNLFFQKLGVSCDQAQNFKLKLGLSSTILIMYFDLSSNLWEDFLTKPLEWSLIIHRKERNFHSGGGSMHTSIDFDSYGCFIAFSEQLLISLGVANHTWAGYVKASNESPKLNISKSGNASEAIKRSLARSLVTSFPYSVKNLTGQDFTFSVTSSSDPKHNRECLAGHTKFFQYEFASGCGKGRKRLYGQDAKNKKSIKIFINHEEILVENIDLEINKSRRAHQVGKLSIFTEVCRDGKTTVVLVTSQMKINNQTCIPFTINVLTLQSARNLGICSGFKTKEMATTASVGTSKKVSRKLSKTLSFSTATSASNNPSSIGVPIDILNEYIEKPNSADSLKIGLSSNIKNTLFTGTMCIPALENVLKAQEMDKIEVLLVRSDSKQTQLLDVDENNFVVNVFIKSVLVDSKHALIDIFIQPRTLMYNKLPIKLSFRTTMHHVYSTNTEKSPPKDEDFREEIITIHSGNSVEIFTYGPILAFNVTYADHPIDSAPLGWSDLIIPLGKGRFLGDPVPCTIPLNNKINGVTEEIDFYLAEESHFLMDEFEMDEERPRMVQNNDKNSNTEMVRSLFFSSSNTAVDRTRTILFKVIKGQWSPTFNVNDIHHTLLPNISKPLRLFRKSRDKASRSLPFFIEEISICNGGIESSPILWEDKSRSEFYVYRKIKSSSSQIHIIPEFVVFNGCNETLSIKQRSGDTMTLEPQAVLPLFFENPDKALIAFNFPSLMVGTDFYRVDLLKTEECVLLSLFTGDIFGTCTIQTEIGGTDSRLVIKVGLIKEGKENLLKDQRKEKKVGENPLTDDFITINLSISTLRITVKDSKEMLAVVKVLFQGLFIEFQHSPKLILPGGETIVEHSSFHAAVNNFMVFDGEEKSQHPQMIKSLTKSNFLVFDVIFTGSLNEEQVEVESVKLAFARSVKGSSVIVINTGEEFLWKLLDVTNRVMAATEEMTGITLNLDWSEEEEKFIVSLVQNLDNGNQIYYPPQSGKSYHVKSTEIDPVIFRLSFLRAPQKSRYKEMIGESGAAVKYFTNRLKFKIDKADVKFESFVAKDLKGHSKVLIDQVKAVYMHRVKMQLLMILSAVSIQDWSALAARTGGSEEYVEGDILRITGNAIGSSAGFILESLATGVGEGVETFTGAIGGGFQTATETIGLGKVGQGVNQVVTTGGQGVGTAVKGAGKGANFVVKSTGRVVGHITGGIFGAVEYTISCIGSQLNRLLCKNYSQQNEDNDTENEENDTHQN